MNLQEAISVLTEELRKDPDYFETWKANIAMAFQDEYAREAINEPYDFLYCPTTADVHRISNNAAINFLKLLTFKQ